MRLGSPYLGVASVDLLAIHDLQGAHGEGEALLPARLAIGEHSKLAPGLSSVWRLSGSRKERLLGSFDIEEFVITPSHDPVGVAPLVVPGGSGELEVVLASLNRLPPPSVEAQLSSVVEGVAGAVGVFFYRKLQKIHVLSPALGRVRLVDGEEEVGLSPYFCDASVRYRIFVARMMPHVSMSGVDFLVEEADPTAPIKHVTEPGGLTFDPDTLNLLSPTGLKNLVNV